MRKIECFKIRVLEDNGDHIWEIDHQRPIHDILCDHFLFKLNPIVIVADPFLFVYEDKLFLFYEMKRNYSPGVICMISTRNLKDWTNPIVVLKEEFHLSYPYVFEDGGDVYMIPETSEVGNIRLYKADNNKLSSFSICNTLIHREVTEGEIGFVDSSVFKKDGCYYLFTTIEQNGKNVLYLYFSDRLDGTYIQHPSSPICESMKYGRNGGGVINHKGLLYRVAQDCEKRYGDNIHVLAIDELSSISYKEHLFKESIVPTKLPFHKEGGHHFNYVRYLDKYITVTDSKEYNTFLFSRIVHKSTSFFKSPNY